MGYTKKQALATPGLQRISDKKKKSGGGGLTRLPDKNKPITRPKPKPGPGPKPVRGG